MGPRGPRSLLRGEIHRGLSFDVTGKQYGQAQHLLKPVPGFPLITKEETFRRVDRFLSNQHFNGCSHAFHKLIEHWDMFTATIAAEIKPKRETVEDPEITWVCINCHHAMLYKRSRWLQYKNKSGCCSNCGKSFNVNDVLNQTPTIKNFLPNQEAAQ